MLLSLLLRILRLQNDGITSPVPYHTFQRDRNNVADIPIVGEISVGGISNIEARFNGGNWQTIAVNVTNIFKGTLTGQAAGQGVLECRKTRNPNMVFSVEYVGVGDVFIVAGQSNASGRAMNLQSYTHTELRAVLFGNDYIWKNLVDPVDDPAGQIDKISDDTGFGPSGSFVPLLATELMAETGYPTAFVPCAIGASSITDWLPSDDHLDQETLFGSMVYRATLTKACMVLWWQGETDALAAMNQSTYNEHLDTLANAINADLDIKIMPCQLQACSGISRVDEAEINAAIAEAWADNTNVLEGPDFSDLPSDDDFHLQSDSNLLTAAARWSTAILATL